ncbi:MAG: hypothetical protein RMJ43_04925 [Chloroherpetonaceae bacterium]|nr:hypothetical protein [Chthonomonadaceae bacterium]MDW8207158.1 hypothetical protein [Chloroherpetonaceae bacterium]
MDGFFAVAVLTIILFAIFILWARTETGRATLRNALGEPGFPGKRRRIYRRRHAAGPSTAKAAARKRSTRR